MKREEREEEEEEEEERRCRVSWNLEQVGRWHGGTRPHTSLNQHTHASAPLSLCHSFLFWGPANSIVSILSLLIITIRFMMVFYLL